MIDLGNNSFIRYSTQADVDILKHNLRKDDILEIWASNHHTPEEALQISLDESIVSLTFAVHNLPVAIFGINPPSAFENKAIIWMLASPALYNVKVKFLRNCTRVIESFLAYYPYLYNYVDARNTKTIRWLEYLGAEISEPRDYGAENLPFHFFSFSGKLKKDKKLCATLSQQQSLVCP